MTNQEVAESSVTLSNGPWAATHHIAILAQDHQLFPLPLKETIGLGNPTQVNDLVLINAAAKKGGAVLVIQKLEQRLNTVLDHMGWTYGDNLVDDPADHLRIELEKLEKKISFRCL